MAAIAAFGFAGTAQASHKGFSHGVTSNNSGGGNSVDVTIACTFDEATSTLSIDSDVADVTGDGGTFSGMIDVRVECFEKADGDPTFSSCGFETHGGVGVPFNDTDDFDGGLSFSPGGEDDLTGVVTVTGSTDTPGSLDFRTFFANCDTEQITVVP